MNIDSIIKIQSSWRGYKQRKLLNSLKDGFTKELIDKYLDHYIKSCDFRASINSELKNKKCRNENFPSEISENICKLALAKKFNIMPNWDTLSGDLQLEKKRIEVKGFMSDGPSSFGPAEYWDYICFVDAKRFREKYFKVYLIKLKNDSKEWRNIMLTSKISYGEVADENRRGQLRASFYKIFLPQLKEHTQLIYAGSLDEL